MSLVRAMKYMGDDQGSWAIFRSADVKRLRSPIVDDRIRPMICGLTRSEVPYYKKTCEETLRKRAPSS